METNVKSEPEFIEKIQPMLKEMSEKLGTKISSITDAGIGYDNFMIQVGSVG